MTDVGPPIRCLFAPICLTPQSVAKYRRIHDPLSTFCPPHVTFVFPFRSPMEDPSLVEHCARVLAVQAIIPVAFASAQRHLDGTVQLAVTEGGGDCRALHQRLYHGPLEKHLSPGQPFSPHVTIGRWPIEATDIELPINPAEMACIKTLVLERIGPDNQSLPIRTFQLR